MSDTDDRRPLKRVSDCLGDESIGPEGPEESDEVVQASDDA